MRHIDRRTREGSSRLDALLHACHPRPMNGYELSCLRPIAPGDGSRDGTPRDRNTSFVKEFLANMQVSHLFDGLSQVTRRGTDRCGIATYRSRRVTCQPCYS